MNLSNDDLKETSYEVKGDKIHIGVPFYRVDAENRTVEGFATLDNVDKTGDIVDYNASKEAFNSWVGNIREMHGTKAVGKAIQIEERQLDVEGKTYNGFWVKSYISKGAQDTWEKILDGTLQGYSVGGRVLEKRPEVIKNDGPYSSRQVMRITKYLLGELSVVDNPANQLSMLEGIHKALIKVDGDNLTASNVLADKYQVFYCEKCDITKTDNTGVDDIGCAICESNMKNIATAYELPSQEDIQKAVFAVKNSATAKAEGANMDELKKENEPSFLPDGSKVVEPGVAVSDETQAVEVSLPANSVPSVNGEPGLEKGEDLQLNTNTDNNSLVDILATLVDAITAKVTKAIAPAKVEEVIKAENTGGEEYDVDKDTLVKAIEEVLVKWNVINMNSEKADDVTTAKTDSLAGTHNTNELQIQGGDSASRFDLPAPDSGNVMPKITKADEATAGEELKKAEETSKVEELIKGLSTAFETKFGEVASRLEKIETSGASRKSDEVSEELKKSAEEESFWGGMFQP